MNVFKRVWNALTEPGDPRSTRTLFFGRNKTAGVPVTHENALTYSPVWRAVNLISQNIAMLPWTVNQRDAQRNSQTLWTHPAYNLLALQPNEETNALTFRQVLIAWALTWGNGYAEIVRDRANRPAALWQLDPTRVRPDRTVAGKLIYEVSNGSAPNSIIEPANMYHLKGLGFDGLTGYSVIAYAARNIGHGIATEDFGGNFFRNGAHSNIVFEHPEKLSDKAYKNLTESLKEHYSGDNVFNPIVVEEGTKANPISIPPDDAQFLETKKHSVADVARWYGVPLHKMAEMDKSSFNNIEAENISFVTEALLYWIKSAEMEADIKLVSPAQRGRIYTKMNVNALLRGDTASRAKWYTAMSSIGAYTVNKVLQLEDENTIGAVGDKNLVQMNLTTLENAGKQSEPDTETTPPIEEDEQAGEEAEGEATARAILVANAGRIISRCAHRAEEALKNYDGDRDGLIKYLDKFSAGQRDYMRKELATPIEAFNLKIDLDQFIEISLAEQKNIVLEAFDNGGHMFHVEPSRFVDDLLETRAP